jgi:two-component system chemotaxis sensor kinase CheA
MRFAIPQISVMELVRAADGTDTKIERINTTCVLRLRDRLLPLVRLSEVLQLPQQTSAASSESYIVVAKAGGRTFGIVVDTVFDTFEIVVKPVSPILKEIPMYSGNTILGDGSVIMILDPNGVAAAIAGEVGSRNSAEEAVAQTPSVGDSRQALLLFRAGSDEPKAIPLSAVTRLEVVDTSKIERANGRHVLQYRGALMPIVTSLSAGLKESGGQPVIVFTDGNRAVGVAVQEILDIVEAQLNVELAPAEQGLLGTAVIRERATEVVDIAHHVSEVFRTWFATKPQLASRRHVLLIDDSPFFRTMISPLLSAAGYDVTEAATAEVALKFRDEGRIFDLILSDTHIPGTDGRSFASLVKADPQWSSTPVVGLASELQRGEKGAFDAVTHKFDRDGLMTVIRTQLSIEERAA